MKFKIVSALAALTLLLSTQTAEAAGNKNPSKPIPGNPGNPVNPGNPIQSARNLGNYTALCNTVCCAVPATASSSFQSNSNIGPHVRLQVSDYGFASTSVKGLQNQSVQVYGGIQFKVNGPMDNFRVYINYTPPFPGNTTIDYAFSVASGGIQKSSQADLYFIGTNDKFGQIQLPAGSRINIMQFQLQGTGGGQITDRVYGVSYTGYGGVGIDLNDPSAFCTTN